METASKDEISAASVADTGSRERDSAARVTLVLVLFLAVAVYATWPLSRYMGSRVPQNLFDSLENAWIFGWNAHAFTTNPLKIFNANIFYPEPLTLAYAENLLGVSVFVAPIFWLTKNALLTANIAYLLMYAVAGLGVYLLVRELGGSRVGSFLAGFAFSVAPYRLIQIAHPHVVAIHLVPFILLLLIRLRRSRSRWVLVGIALLVALQMWSSITGGLIMLIAITGFGIWEVIRLRTRSLPVVGRAAASVIVGLVLAIPVALPYIEVRKLHPEFQHSPGEIFTFSALPSSYLSPAEGRGPLVRSSNDWLDKRFRARDGFWEKTLFPGYWLGGAFLLTLALLGVALVRRRKAPWIEPAALFLFIATIGFVASLGPRYGGPSGIRLPFSLVSDLIPGGFVRVPARFGTVTLLGMSIAAGVVLGGIRSRPARALIAVSGLFLLLEAAPSPFPMIEPPPLSRALQQVPRSGAVLALPTTQVNEKGNVVEGSIFQDTRNLYLSTGNFAPMVNGYGAFHPQTYWEVMSAVQDFPSAVGMQRLQVVGVKTVVIQTERIKGTPWSEVVERLEAWKGVRRIASGEQIVVFDISMASD